jgi:protein ImuA
MRSDSALGDPFSLRPKRVHEAEGRGRRAFAQFQAARHSGPLVWILPAHAPEMPMLRGLPQGVGERLHLLRPVNETDLLWCIEEALRAVPVGLVIAEPSQPLSLTAGRRFQLAAEAGQTTGLMLIQTDAGSNATETRWKCDPQASNPDSTLHQWTLKKKKTGNFKKLGIELEWRVGCCPYGFRGWRATPACGTGPLKGLLP